MLVNHVKTLPPRHAPNANAQTRGCNGRFSSRLCARLVAIRTIIVVNGMLSMKALAKAETHRRSRIATASWDSSFTERITASVCWPIQDMRPSLASAYDWQRIIGSRMSSNYYDRDLPPLGWKERRKRPGCSIRRELKDRRDPHCLLKREATKRPEARSSRGRDSNLGCCAGRIA